MKNVITIDGPSGVGKTTIGQVIATKLNFQFFSSGKLYRYVSKYSYDKKSKNFEDFKLTIDINGNCFINNINYKDEELYTKNINKHSSEVAKDPLVRKLVKTTLLTFYNDINNNDIYYGLVIEGRDMGSVVFPNAKFKIYLDADKSIRGKRREHQSHSQETMEEIIQRDQKDMNREESPLIIPEDAILIDNTNKTIDETIEKIIEKLKL
tara:strand:+ start:41 stop:667 length:627 start_codon:yes stop_codon:yes gene_type:complete